MFFQRDAWRPPSRCARRGARRSSCSTFPLRAVSCAGRGGPCSSPPSGNRSLDFRRDAAVLAIQHGPGRRRATSTALTSLAGSCSWEPRSAPTRSILPREGSSPSGALEEPGSSIEDRDAVDGEGLAAARRAAAQRHRRGRHVERFGQRAASVVGRPALLRGRCNPDHDARLSHLEARLRARAHLHRDDDAGSVCSNVDAGHAQRVTKLTSFGGRTITRRTSRSPIARRAFSDSRARRSASSSETSAGASIVSRTFPSTCTTSVT